MDFEKVSINAVKFEFSLTKFFFIYAKMYIEKLNKQSRSRWNALLRCIPFWSPTKILNTFNDLKTLLSSESNSIVKWFKY